ncbi:hypothetical protein IT408_00300 [Candidatus Uhrbacteria bacterium]|nr:hypothetical protein [Candidatus Uhrbacteria bacterium]
MRSDFFDHILIHKIDDRAEIVRVAAQVTLARSGGYRAVMDTAASSLGRDHGSAHNSVP